jgi:LemA protein
MNPITLVLGIAAALLLAVVYLYNRFVSLNTRAEASWSDIDALLKQRYDLIPNLVETVKGYASHENKTLEEVTKWRSASMNATTPAQKAQAENQLTGMLKSLFAVAEAYPDLKANQNFLKLQGTLEQVENNIQSARRYYNAVVRDYNVAIKSFPGNFIANQFHFAPREFFELATPAEREAPKVQF